MFSCVRTLTLSPIRKMRSMYKGRKSCGPIQNPNLTNLIRPSFYLAKKFPIEMDSFSRKDPSANNHTLKATVSFSEIWWLKTRANVSLLNKDI